MKLLDRVMRLWLYFRTGYATYISYPAGVGQMIIIFYALFISTLPSLSPVFPNIMGFGVFCVLLGVPACMVVGWMHYKKLPAYSQEQEVYAESNPYMVNASAVYAALVLIAEREGVGDAPEIRRLRELCHD